MSSNIVKFQISLNDETAEALVAAVEDRGSKVEIFREALTEWLYENGYLDAYGNRR